MSTPGQADAHVLAQSDYGVAFALLAAMQTELQSTRQGAPDTMYIHPGSVDPPMYEDCALGWVVIVRVRTWDGNGEVGLLRAGRPIIPGWQISLRAGVYRCYPVKKDNARPSEGELDSYTRDEADDRLAMFRAAIHNPWWKASGAEVALGSAKSVGPAGGRHGAVLDLSVFTTDLCSPPDGVFPRLPGDPLGDL